MRKIANSKSSNRKLPGLYIHIPFCKSRCIYCAFYSTTDLRWRQRYVDAVCREWQLRSHELSTPVTTVYFGGGTPSQLTPQQLQQLLTALPPSVPEATIEANPDDITPTYAATLSQLDINRVSMGAQTFDDQRLHFLHRRHTSGQVKEAVHHLRSAGIHNISIDLMYGFPGETLSDWERDINAALALDVEHISAYCLTVEKGTPLFYQMRNENQRSTTEGEVKFEMRLPSEELERAMYERLIDKLEAAGYEHYEISNFAKPGFRSRHNSSYWQDIPYIGLGAAAHSYDSRCRSWNISDIRQYMEAMERGERLFESETLDDDTHYNDRITVALRTREGLDLTTLSPKHRRYCLKEAQRFIDNGELRIDGDHLSLTRKGLFISDYIMSSLIYI